MPSYEIEWTIAYEGIQRHDADSLEEVVAWLKGNQSRYEWTLDNVTIRGATGEVDAYELVRRAEAGEPLTVAGFGKVEAEVLGILSDVRAGAVNQETLDRVERLRTLLVGLMPEETPAPPGRSGP